MFSFSSNIAYTQALSIECPSVQAIACVENVSLDLSLIQVTTNCSSGYEIEVVNTEFQGANLGQSCDFSDYIFTVEATDECGGFATCDVWYTVIGTAPTFPTSTLFAGNCTLPELVKECGNPFIDHEEVTQNWIDEMIALDACGNPVQVSNNYDKDNFTYECGLSGYQVVTFTAVDYCGRTSTCQGTIRNIDTKGPSFAKYAEDKTVECDSMINDKFDWWILNNGGAVAIDCCGMVSWTTNPETPEWESPCGEEDDGIIEVDFIVMDECGFVDTTSASFIVEDNTPPFFLDDFSSTYDTLQCGDIGNFEEPTAEDYCGDVVITHEDSEMEGDCSNTYVSITRTWTATDACGNTAMVSQTQVFIDTIPPVFTGIETDIVFYCCEDIVIPEPTVTDNCSEEITITYTDEYNTDGLPAPNCNNGYGYDITRTWTATDECGNVSTATTAVWVKPGSPYPINFTNYPSDQVIGCNDSFEFADLMANSDCEGEVTLVYEDFTSESDCGGSTYTRTWTATDECCGEETISQTFTILPDNTPPSFTFVPGDMTLYCSDDLSIGDATAQDDCNGVTVTYTETYNTDGPPAPNCNNGFGYDIFRVWTATDGCGNVATATTDVWIKPNDLSLSFDNSIENLTIACNDNVRFTEVTASSDCGEVSLTYEDIIEHGECNTTIYKRVWTARDACEQEIKTSQIINQIDNTAPEFTDLPADVAMTYTKFLEYQTPVLKAKDNCNPFTISAPELDTNSDCEAFMPKFTWQATDECGNMASHTMKVFIEDALPKINVIYPEGVKYLDIAEINLELEGGIPPFEVEWKLNQGVAQSWKLMDTDNMKANIQIGRDIALVNVAVTNGFGCVKEKQIAIRHTELGTLYSAQQANKFNAYPNPTAADLQLSYHLEEANFVEVVVYDLLGQIVMRHSFDSDAGENLRRLNVRELPPATYIAHVQIGFHTHQVKFIKSEE